MNNKQYISLYANCIPVKGEIKSMIYDLQRKKSIDIPNDLYDFVHFFETHSLSELYDLNHVENHKVINEYIQFLIDEELAFITDEGERELFPKLNMSWDYPSQISNVILEISEVTFPILNKIIEFVIALGCEHMYLKIKMENSLVVIQNILDLLNTTPIYSIVLEAQLGIHEEISNYELVISDNKRVDTLFLITQEKQITSSKKIAVSITEDFISRKEYFFSINIPFFTEAQKHNVYFNRKLYINHEGIIKNAPETNDTFGNIQEISLDNLKHVVNSSQFQKYWKINKDSIKECQNCEYRYMCTDNRLPLIDTNGNYYFKTKCEIKTLC